MVQISVSFLGWFGQNFTFNLPLSTVTKSVPLGESAIRSIFLRISKGSVQDVLLL